VWPPLLDHAVMFSIANPALLARAEASSEPIPLVSRHLVRGGAFPAELVRQDFLNRVVDGAMCANRSEDCLSILRHLDRRAGSLLLDHPKADEAFRVNVELVHGAVEEWWRRFLASESTGRPPSRLVADALQVARTQTRDRPIVLVISLLRLFPEISERDFENWMEHTGHLWESGDYGRMAKILLDRRWNSAARAFRWSWKRELKLVAWYARDLLSWYDRFRDDAARVFAAAFYRGLAFGRSVRSAFDLGINELRLAGLGPEDSIPQLLIRNGADEELALVGVATT
jgi:hypothetical protein